MSDLPIERLQREFSAAITRSDLVVEAPTGSGKSTRLPQWCAAAGPVLVVEPRRIACRALAARVAEECGAVLGEEVGYAIRFDARHRDATRILFATPGIALGWLSEGGLGRFTTVVLDEFHERRWDTDLLAALLKRRGRHRLIISSATVEGERLAHWLGGERLRAGGRLHPVEIGHVADEGGLELRGLEQRVAQQVRRMLEQEPAGDILVFLPGKGEIQAAWQQLEGTVEAEIIPLHAGVDSAVQDRALRPSGQRRVILATNVAETSLTIPGVRMVVDSGLERRTHHRNGRTVLGLHPVSRAAADQRAGRAGRLGPGRCIRLWGRRAPLEPFTPPEVLREELTELLLASAAAGVPATELSFPDPLPAHAVTRATERLRGMDAIDAAGRLTDHGRRLAPLPLDALFAHLITAMPDGQTRAAMVDLAAALSAGRPLLPRIQDGGQADLLKKWQPQPCDVATLVALVRSDPPHYLPVDRSTLQEARRIAAQTREALGLPARAVGPGFPREPLLVAVLRVAPELAFVRRAKRRQALGNGGSEIEVGRESRFPEQAEAALVFDQHSLPGRGTRQTLNFGTCMAPVEFGLLAGAGLGEIDYGAPVWEAGQLRVEARRVFAGRVIASGELSPTGEPARRTLAGLVLEGRLLRPAGERLAEDIDAWNLYLHLGLGGGEPVQVRPWLERRLAELGVESGGDMALIEPEDVAFEGIPEWERGAFDTRWPRHLMLENMQVAVSYRPLQRRVTLERRGGIRRTPPRPQELPAWSGWCVYFKDASRVVRIK